MVPMDLGGGNGDRCVCMWMTARGGHLEAGGMLEVI